MHGDDIWRALSQARRNQQQRLQHSGPSQAMLARIAELEASHSALRQQMSELSAIKEQLEQQVVQGPLGPRADDYLRQDSSQVRFLRHQISSLQGKWVDSCRRSLDCWKADFT